MRTIAIAAFALALCGKAALAQSVFSVDDVRRLEGDAGTAPFVFTITRTGDTTGTASVYAAPAGLHSSFEPNASHGIDWVGDFGQRLTFAPGVTTASYTVQVRGDVDPEPDEGFSLSLRDPMGATVARQGLGTILNDDGPVPTVSVTDATVVEGDDGTTYLVFRLTRTSGMGSASVGLFWQSGTALWSTDFSSQGTLGPLLSFQQGETSISFLVPVFGDRVFEPDETLLYRLAKPYSLAIADGTAVGTIVNDDPQPTISVGDATIAEGTVGTTTVGVVVSLSNPSSQAITVSLATFAGSAAAPDDYIALGPMTVTFLPGVTSQQINFPVVADTLAEGLETLTVTLSNPTNATIADGTGTVTIVDDDLGVGQGPATPVPALTPAMLAWLAAMFALVAMLALRRRAA